MEFEKLQKIIAEVLNVDTEEITMDTTFVDDLGADSLDVFQIIMGIEEEFDIEIPNEEAEKIVTAVSYTHLDVYKRQAKEVGVNFIGGYSALVSKGMTKSDENLIRSIPQALAVTERVCSSVNVGSTKCGINMDAVRLMGEIILETAEYTKEEDSLGCAKLVVFCNAPDDNPFMAGAFHGVTEADAIINVGVSGPGVVKTALEQVRGESFEAVSYTHLDVYKRQAHTCEKGRRRKGGCPEYGDQSLQISLLYLYRCRFYAAEKFLV